MTDEILALNSSNELIAKDPNTGNVRPIEVSDLSASSRLNLDDGALLTLGSNDDFGLRYDATADSFVVADNTNGTDTVTVDRTTGDIDTVGDVSATNVSADTQMNSSSKRPNIFADNVDVNSITGVSTGGIKTKTRVFASVQSSATPVQFDSITYDPDNNFDTTTHEYIVPANGTYEISFSAFINNSVGAGTNVTFNLQSGNTTLFQNQNEAPGDFFSATGSDVRELTNGDPLTLSNPEGITIKNSEARTFMSIIRLE